MRATGTGVCVAPRGCRPGRAGALLAVGLALTGCSAMSSRDRATRFEEQVGHYAAAVRWGYYDTAASFIRPRVGSAPVPDCVPRAAVRVTSFQIREQSLSDDAREARVRAVIGYLSVESGAVREASDVETWWYDEDARRWFLDGGLPPVVCEPVSPGAPPR
jgi:hypothetical protein